MHAEIGSSKLHTSEASMILQKMYKEGLERGEAATSIHLFGIRYSKQLQGLSLEDIVGDAKLPPSYKTEIRKGMNLAKYVRILDV